MGTSLPVQMLRVTVVWCPGNCIDNISRHSGRARHTDPESRAGFRLDPGPGSTASDVHGPGCTFGAGMTKGHMGIFRPRWSRLAGDIVRLRRVIRLFDACRFRLRSRYGWRIPCQPTGKTRIYRISGALRRLGYRSSYNAIFALRGLRAL